MPKKAASATSSKSLRVLVNLKHLGNLHNELSHGNWSKGPRGKLVGAVRRRLGDDIDDAEVQGGGGVKGKPKISKTLSSIQDIRLSRNAVIQEIDARNFTGRQLQQITEKLLTETRKWKNNPNKPEVDADMAIEMAEEALTSVRGAAGSRRGGERTAKKILVVLRDGEGRAVGLASYYKSRTPESNNGAWVVEFLGANPSSGNRAGETIMYHLGRMVQKEVAEGVISLNPLDSARRFYEKIGFLPVHPQLPFMAWEPWRRREFVARVQTRLDAENAAPPSESTKEKGASKMTPELEKYFAELDAIYEKYGCSVGSPSSAKKAASATSSKSLRVLVNLKHLGNLHNELSHGNWSKGPRGKLVGAVGKRLGGELGGILGSPVKKPNKKLLGSSSLEDIDDTAAYKTTLKVEVVGKGLGKFGREVQAAFDALPQFVKEDLIDHGIKIKVGRFLSSIDHALLGVTPPGFPAHMTWDNAGGLYNWGTKVIGISKFSIDAADESGMKIRTNGWRQTLFHEVGHGFDASYGGASGRHREFLAAYKKDIKQYSKDNLELGILRYFSPLHRYGKMEAWAEAFTTVMSQRTEGEDGPAFAALFPNIVGFMQGLVDDFGGGGTP